jgi:phosphoglycolate phosphatase
VVFDLDGTLVDTAPDIRVAVNQVLAEHGLAELSLPVIRSLIGQGPHALLAKAFEREGRDVSEMELNAATDRFRDLYLADIARLGRPFPGALEALAALDRSGAALAMCTNKSERLTRALLDELGLTARFAAIATPETAGASKPDPVHLLAAIAASAGRPERSVMVGDSAADARAARAAGVALVLVEFGYCEGAAADLEPDVLIGHFHELPGAVARLLAQEPKAIAASPALDA